MNGKKIEGTMTHACIAKNVHTQTYITLIVLIFIDVHGLETTCHTWKASRVP